VLCNEYCVTKYKFIVWTGGSCRSGPHAGTEVNKVLEYGPGGAFGELALLHGEPRLATVRAVGPCE
jgi:CRP-like cAMP-binding protein